MDANSIASYYRHTHLAVPTLWNLSRKHIRIVLSNDQYMKLNCLRPRLNRRVLRSLYCRFVPIHVYMSVLDWLFPERVGKKYKAKYAVPINGEYVVDVDSHVCWVPHYHDTVHPICVE